MSLVVTRPQVILGSAALPSVGSGGHATGECKPCAFFHSKGCASGKTCLFCHLCDGSDKRRRKHERRHAAAASEFGLPVMNQHA